MIIILSSLIIPVAIKLTKKLNKKEENEIIISNKNKNNLIKNEKQEEQVEKLLKVDIKGEVAQPGIYSLKEESRVIDQTTPNMIQKLKPLFARNPLISKGI